MSARSTASRITVVSDYVEAPLTYLADTSVKPVTYNPPMGQGEIRRVGNYGTFTARIYDARPIVGDLSLEREGFLLARHDTAVKDFYDAAEVKSVYYPEMERLVARATGAAKVVVFDHTVRSGERAVERGLRQPVRMVHNDYTEKSGPQRVRDLLPAEEAERRLRHRFVEINVWRPIRGVVEAMPLALADAQSIKPTDLVTADLVYADRTGEIYHGLQSAAPLVLLPAHAAPRGRADQVLRQRDRRPRPLLPAHRLRRPHHPRQRPAPREHRDPHAGVLRGVRAAAKKKVRFTTETRRARRLSCGLPSLCPPCLRGEISSLREIGRN